MRQDIDLYFIEMSRLIGTRSTCNRGHVGCVIVIDKQMITSGYSGSPRGMDHCDDVGHYMIDNHCIRSTHAEINAIVNAAKNGIKINKAELYITMFPCFSCAKAVVNAGIKRVISEYDHPNSGEAKNLFFLAGIKYKIINKENKKYDK